MATRYYSFAEGEYYHVYNRGNSKQVIFNESGDYERFKQALYIANSSKSFKIRELDETDVFDIDRPDVYVHIGAYCLMPNHFHILLTPAQKDGVPKFMLKLATSYASYYNKKYNRVGSLFEGSYRVKYVDSDPYLKYLFSYIHLNPFRDKEGEVQKFYDVKKLLEFTHSSLPEYLGIKRKYAKILERTKFPEYFDSVEAQSKELFEWLDYHEI